MKIIKKILHNPSAVAGLVLLLFICLCVTIGPLFTPSVTDQNLLNQFASSSAEHPMGTDEFGRDVFARIVMGGRYTLISGIVSVILGLAVGIIMGAASGYYGGACDYIIMMICDIMLAFPSVILAMAITIVLGSSMFTLMVAVGISSSPIFARLVRAQFMSLRDATFVEATRLSGASDLRIIFCHLLPNSMGPILIQGTLRIGSSILLAATLSFLGLGVQPPTPEWGSMLNSARQYMWESPMLGVWPGLAITVTVIAINLIGDALRDYLDPRTCSLL